MSKIERTVTYKVWYISPGCFDDGGPWHDTFYDKRHPSSTTLEAQTDKEAQIQYLTAAKKPWHEEEHCSSHPPKRRPQLLKIEKTLHEKTEDGFERTTVTEVPFPRSSTCACRKVYWPVLGEKPCHQLVAISA